MNLKVMMTNFGFNHAQIEIEENCKIEELGTVMDRIRHELAKLTEQPANQSRTDKKGQGGEKKFNPASDGSLRALNLAAKANGTDVATVCHEFNVDPAHISAKQCYDMIQELNRQSGYVNKKPSDSVGDIWGEQYEN